MPQFVVMFPADDEAAWSAATQDERQVVYDVDAAFVGAVRGAGGRVVGGAEVAPSDRTRTLSRSAEGTQVSPGPWGAGPGRLSGLILVESPDLETVLRAAEGLLEGHPVVEVHPTLAD